MDSSLQTLAFIQVAENLLNNNNIRIPDSEEESVFLTHYHETHELLENILHNPEIVLFWNITLEKIKMRKILLRNLDLYFHKRYMEIMKSFQKVRELFLQIAPGTQKVDVYSLPSIKDLVELYVKKTGTLQKSLYRDELVEEESLIIHKIEKTPINNTLIIS